MIDRGDPALVVEFVHAVSTLVEKEGHAAVQERLLTNDYYKRRNEFQQGDR